MSLTRKQIKRAVRRAAAAGAHLAGCARRRGEHRDAAASDVAGAEIYVAAARCYSSQQCER